jgi:transposase
MEDCDGRQVVGMDLHRRRSVLVRMTEDGRRLGVIRIADSAAALRQALAGAGHSPRVVLEATYGWHWAAGTLAAAGAEVRRFAGPGKLCSWAGLTPRHRESDTRVRRGHITRQGSRQLRWALCEAVRHQPDGFGPKIVKDSIIARRGKEAKNIAKVAAARELLTLAYYGLRDGRIRCLSLPAPALAA